jgi:hypothetical protein
LWRRVKPLLGSGGLHIAHCTLRIAHFEIGLARKTLRTRTDLAAAGCNRDPDFNAQPMPNEQCPMSNK